MWLQVVCAPKSRHMDTNIGFSAKFHKTVYKKRKKGNTIMLQHFIRDIHKFTLSSPCLWASFHPLTPFGVSKVMKFY
jgi:hypothetical protein